MHPVGGVCENPSRPGSGLVGVAGSGLGVLWNSFNQWPIGGGGRGAFLEEEKEEVKYPGNNQA